ncbi:Uncharacterised protein [Mycobacteroides abscessus subsp. abscessus]|jgi:hypothetical protein|uniref:hypothetical protein n=1 Tax=Mycobacteroides TaxID=670516 RepID=UPI0005E17077|nr:MULTISPECIES: hypothetical protein [Mycobacteroides]MBE5506435.1 hypothetical protein [Mycobacteroides abscessus]MBF9422127.1 hypothetical protein [Mycobacteroides chelonae]MDO3137458.1 hypothetical protein [Mycobacteroides abscessus subsp. abscessus]MDO3154942.1 hypothetical protein [Mycobacteroides abscessus subsp. abscessus]CPS18070.1 Uncharacterised protein [Mycobacteroides abscessus]
MSGLVRFVDDDWAWSSSMTRFLFDFLANQVPDDSVKSEIAELRDDNVLLLDLRDPSKDVIVETIVNDLPQHLASQDSSLQAAFQSSFTELQRLASAQHLHNQSATQ